MTRKVMDCDLVVLGAGGSGMVAAVKAADVSGKKVIVLEKAKKPGGATIFAHGMPIRDSKWQKKAGEAVQAIQDISGQFFDWLATKGGAEEYFRIANPGETRVCMTSLIMTRRMDKYKEHTDPTIGPGWIGSYVVGKMLECCEKMGIPVLTETRAKKFITDAKGGITGVLADTADGELQVNCKACFIGAGSFGADYEKCRKLWPGEFNNKQMMCLCPPTNTGDCIDMAEEIGVAIDLSNAFFTGGGGPTHHPYSHTIWKMTHSMLSVNLNGERWMMDWGEDMGQNPGPNSLASQPGAAVFFIADNDLVEKQGEYIIAHPNEDVDIPILKKWREEIEWEVAMDEAGTHGHHAKKADTLKELALKMDVDPRVFVATIEAYNKSCESGKADDGKGPGIPPWGHGGNSEMPPGFGGTGGAPMPGGPGPMGPSDPIRKPPFYAFYGIRFSQVTKGGIVTDYNTMEVFDKNGRIIPGLFAGGDGITPKGMKRVEPGYGLFNCITTGYKGGISAGKYLSKI